MASRGLLILLIAGVGIAHSALGQRVATADSLARLGVQNNDDGEYAKAEAHLKQALSIYRALDNREKWLLYSLEYGEALVDQAKFDEGLSVFLELRSVDHPILSDSLRARLENDIGWTYKRVDKVEKAYEYYQRALKLSKAAGDSSRMAILYNNISGYYKNTGQYSKAIEYRKLALELFKRHSTPYYISIGYNNVGAIYEELSMYEKALENYQKSVEIREKLGNPDLLATVYNNLAVVDKELGNFNRGMIYYKKSLENRRKAGNPAKTAATLKNIGSLYQKLGNIERAFSYYEEAYNLNKQYSGPRWTSSTLVKMGDAYLELGDLKKARSCYLRALDLRKSFNNPHLIASSYLRLASLSVESREWNTAAKYLEEAKEISGELNRLSLKIQLQKSYYSYYRHLGDYPASLEHARKAHRLTERLPEIRRWNTYTRMAYALRAVDSDSAFWYGDQAIRLLEKARTRASILTTLKAGYFEDFVSFYHDLASWYLENEDYTRAYYLVEASKARGFADELAKAYRNLDQKLPENVRIQKNKKEKAIDRLYSRLESSTDSEQTRKVKKELRSAELDYTAFMNSIQAEHPSYKRFNYPEPVTLEEAQKLCDTGTGIIEYAVSGGRLMALLITRDTVTARVTDVNSRSSGMDYQLSRLVNRFRRLIQEQAPLDSLEQASQPLVRLLLDPFEDQMSSIKNVIIVPDGALAHLPFEALNIDNEYLIERHNIKYIPSLTILNLLPFPASNHRKSLLAVAGGSFGEYTSPASQQRQNQLVSLPSSEREIKAISTYFSNASTYVTSDFSERYLKSMELNDFRFVHLATHGIINEQIPDQSGLLFSVSDSTLSADSEDGILKSSEVYGLDLNAEMVVLSACNTSLGKYFRGEGILGLQRSFFYAGSSTVVSSLWSVYDRSTAYLMKQFYKNILSDSHNHDSWWTQLLRWAGWAESISYGNKAPAMRAAKLEMINHPTYNHPVYWAPFVVVGR